jgi:hypothetical protein
MSGTGQTETIPVYVGRQRHEKKQQNKWAETGQKGRDRTERQRQD